MRVPQSFGRHCSEQRGKGSNYETGNHRQNQKVYRGPRLGSVSFTSEPCKIDRYRGGGIAGVLSMVGWRICLQHVKEELADVMVYSQNLLDKLGLDADEIVNMKMTMNEAKYPVEKAKGKAGKYDRL